MRKQLLIILSLIFAFSITFAKVAGPSQSGAVVGDSVNDLGGNRFGSKASNADSLKTAGADGSNAPSTTGENAANADGSKTDRAKQGQDIVAALEVEQEKDDLTKDADIASKKGDVTDKYNTSDAEEANSDANEKLSDRRTKASTDLPAQQDYAKSLDIDTDKAQETIKAPCSVNHPENC